jgi:hypothetical protein
MPAVLPGAMLRDTAVPKGMCRPAISTVSSPINVGGIWVVGNTIAARRLRAK